MFASVCAREEEAKEREGVSDGTVTDEHSGNSSDI